MQGRYFSVIYSKKRSSDQLKLVIALDSLKKAASCRVKSIQRKAVVGEA